MNQTEIDRRVQLSNELFHWFSVECRNQLQYEGGIKATFLVRARQGEAHLLSLANWKDRTEASSRKHIRLMCTGLDADLLAMFRKGWKADPASPVRPRDSDTRREVAFAYIVTRIVADDIADALAVINGSLREILRAPNGSISGFGPEEWTVGHGEIDPKRTWMVNALPWSPVGPAQRRAAQDKVRKMKGLVVLDESRRLRRSAPAGGEH